MQRVSFMQEELHWARVAPQRLSWAGRWVPMPHEKWGHTWLVPSHPNGRQVFFTRHKSEMCLHPAVPQIKWMLARLFEGLFCCMSALDNSHPFVNYWRLQEFYCCYLPQGSQPKKHLFSPSPMSTCMILPSNPLGGADKAEQEKMDS